MSQQPSYPEYQPLQKDFRPEETTSSSPESNVSPLKPVTDQVQDAARGFKSRGKDLIDQGNSRHLIMDYKDREVLNLPLTVAAVVGGIVVLASPPISVIATVAALFAGVRVRIAQ